MPVCGWPRSGCARGFTIFSAMSSAGLFKRDGGLQLLTTIAVGFALLIAARILAVGADTYWAVAMGRVIAWTGGIPDGIPFAVAPSTGWPNVLVLAELALAALAAPGPIGIVVAQLVVDAVALELLATSARRLGAGDGATAVALALMSIGSLPALASVKLQLFSVVLFPSCWCCCVESTNGRVGRSGGSSLSWPCGATSTAPSCSEWRSPAHTSPSRG